MLVEYWNPRICLSVYIWFIHPLLWDSNERLSCTSSACWALSFSSSLFLSYISNALLAQLFLLSFYLFYHTVAIFPSRAHTHTHARTISSLFLSILPFLFIPRSLTPTPFIPFQIPTSRFHDVLESDPNFSGKEVRPYENESISWQHKYYQQIS